MKQKLFYSMLIIILSMRVFSQTTTINYSSASLGTNCNVFNPGVNVNSVVHQSLAGGVSFTSGTGIFLSTVPSGPNAGGTAFVIQYNFASGFSYTISITAKGDNGVFLRATVVPNLNQFNSASTSSCTPDANVTGYVYTVGVGGISVQPSNSFTTYNGSCFLVPDSKI